MRAAFVLGVAVLASAILAAGAQPALPKLARVSLTSIGPLRLDMTLQAAERALGRPAKNTYVGGAAYEYVWRPGKHEVSVVGCNGGMCGKAVLAHITWHSPFVTARGDRLGTPYAAVKRHWPEALHLVLEDGAYVVIRAPGKRLLVLGVDAFDGLTEARLVDACLWWHRFPSHPEAKRACR